MSEERGIQSFDEFASGFEKERRRKIVPKIVRNLLSVVGGIFCWGVVGICLLPILFSTVAKIAALFLLVAGTGMILKGIFRGVQRLKEFNNHSSAFSGKRKVAGKKGWWFMGLGELITEIGVVAFALTIASIMFIDRVLSLEWPLIIIGKIILPAVVSAIGIGLVILAAGYLYYRYEVVASQKTLLNSDEPKRFLREQVIEGQKQEKEPGNDPSPSFVGRVVQVSEEDKRNLQHYQPTTGSLNDRSGGARGVCPIL